MLLPQCIACCLTAYYVELGTRGFRQFTDVFPARNVYAGREKRLNWKFLKQTVARRRFHGEDRVCNETTVYVLGFCVRFVVVRSF